MLAFLYGDICIFTYIPISLTLYINKYQIIYAYTYICVYVCIYICICNMYNIYIYMYVYKAIKTEIHST